MCLELLSHKQEKKDKVARHNSSFHRQFSKSSHRNFVRIFNLIKTLQLICFEKTWNKNYSKIIFVPISCAWKVFFWIVTQFFLSKFWFPTTVTTITLNFCNKFQLASNALQTVWKIVCPKLNAQKNLSKETTFFKKKEQQTSNGNTNTTQISLQEKKVSFQTQISSLSVLKLIVFDISRSKSFCYRSVGLFGFQHLALVF